MSRLRLMTWNLLEGGKGADGPRLDLIATLLRAVRPDVLVACEAHGLAEDPALLTDLSAAVGMRARVAPARSGSHVALFTRPSVAIVHFEAADLGGRSAALALVRATGFADFVLAGVHLDALDGDVRLAEIEAVLARLPAMPRAVLGDLNSLSHEDRVARRDLLALPLHHVQRHVGADGDPDTRVTQSLARHGFVDAWKLAHAADPPHAGDTVPTSVPQPPRFGAMRLDYVFLSSDMPAALVACEVVRQAPAPVASDHFAVIADLEPHG
jgi:exodeoxyribonuclease-3